MSLEPILLSRKQAAAFLSISLRSIDYLIGQGRLKTRRVGGRVLIPRHECERFASQDNPKPIVQEARHGDKPAR